MSACRRHTEPMPVARLVLACLVAANVLSGCSHRDDRGQGGVVELTVTLSRSGAVGPSFDHAPQGGVHVTVTDDAGGKWLETTNSDGHARLSVPSQGEYEVDISLCPDAPRRTAVARGATANVRFDCTAP
jgi:hypothetical protein